MKTVVTKSDRSSRILEASGDLFARHGYHGTSTREIARVVGLSENTLFRYYNHKEEIFWAALGQRLKGIRLHQELLDGLARCENPRVVLPQLVAQLVDTVILNPEILRLVSVALIELHWKASAMFREHLAPAFSVIKDYFERSMMEGRIRKLDPGLTATAVGMTVLAHFELARFREDGPLLTDNRTLIEAHSRFWLGVLVPDFHSSSVSQEI
jgi:AcrR family transcriptional regulator